MTGKIRSKRRWLRASIHILLQSAYRLGSQIASILFLCLLLWCICLTRFCSLVWWVLCHVRLSLHSLFCWSLWLFSIVITITNFLVPHLRSSSSILTLLWLWIFITLLFLTILVYLVWPSQIGFLSTFATQVHRLKSEEIEKGKLEMCTNQSRYKPIFNNLLCHLLLWIQFSFLAQDRSPNNSLL